MWKKYWEFYAQFGEDVGLVRAAFGNWLALMDILRTGSYAWAADQEPTRSGHNDIRDALRHAYWQCTMTVVFSETESMRWGDAHEKYSTAPDEVRMDLHNNAEGRQAGRMVRADIFPNCSAAVLSMKGVEGGLQEDLTPEPSMTTAPSGRPAPPPLAY